MKTTQRATILAATWKGKQRGNTREHKKNTAELKMNTTRSKRGWLTSGGMECT